MTPEAPNVERKPSWRDEHLDYICGFANGQGGVLEIGRDGCGETVGVSDILCLIEEIPTKVRSLLGIVVQVDPRSDCGRDYLRIVVPSHPTPISYKRRSPYPTTALPADAGVQPDDSTRRQPENQEQPENSQKTSDPIVAFPRENPEANRRDMVTELGDATEGSVRYQLDKLKACGRLRRVGPDRGGHWIVVAGHDTQETEWVDAGAGDQRGLGKPQLDHSQTTTRKKPDNNQKTARSDDRPPDALPLSDRILALLRQNPSASRREIAVTLAATDSTVRYRLDKLRAAAKIARIGRDKGGHWKVLDELTTEPDPGSAHDPGSPE